VSVPSLMALLIRGRGTKRYSIRCITELPSCCVEERFWKGRPEWVIAPYSKHTQPPLVIPSNAGTVKTGVNPWGPPHKPKYSLATDSELVP
jgi:hypothetical protein